MGKQAGAYYPENGFVAGTQEQKKKMFIARAKFEKGLQPCQLKEGHNGAQMPYGGDGKTLSNYEVLSASDALFWKPIIVGGLPEFALQTGNEANGNALYSVKYEVSGKKYLGKYNGFDKAYFVIDHKEKEILNGEMEILCCAESVEKKSVSIGG